MDFFFFIDKQENEQTPLEDTMTRKLDLQMKNIRKIECKRKRTKERKERGRKEQKKIRWYHTKQVLVIPRPERTETASGAIRPRWKVIEPDGYTASCALARSFAGLRSSPPSTISTKPLAQILYLLFFPLPLYSPHSSLVYFSSFHHLKGDFFLSYCTLLPHEFPFIPLSNPSS